jgi:hypothetical protein
MVASAIIGYGLISPWNLETRGGIPTGQLKMCFDSVAGNRYVVEGFDVFEGFGLSV